MAKTFVTDISEFVNAAGELRAMPIADRRLAAFLTAIIEAETRYFPTTGHDTGMGCRKCGCQGTILASLPAIDGEIAWRCSVCKQKGVIRNWQGTKWDYTAEAAAAQLYGQGRPVSRLHLLLHQASPPQPGRTRYSALLQDHAAGRA